MKYITKGVMSKAIIAIHSNTYASWFEATILCNNNIMLTAYYNSQSSPHYYNNTSDQD